MSLESKIYTKEEVMKTSLEYFAGDKLSAEQWIRKYALKDSDENLYERSPEHMHKRLAKEIFRIESKYDNPMTEDEIYNLLKDFKYIIPGGSNMSGIGNEKQVVSLSNCFVIGNKSDSYGGIMYTDQQQVQLMKRRGGVGHDLSHIRPKGSPVKNSALTSTGVVPFMERYSNSTKEVAQDGRRGALMLSISIKHPDAEDFIDAKLGGGKVTGANVSVKIDDEFMKAVKEGRKYIQQYPIDSNNPSFTKEIDAKRLWDKIVHNAWKSGEPGVLFWDKISRESIPDNYGDEWKTVSTNPCGEIPLCPYDSCRLEAMNLYSYVENPFTDKARFNEEKFKEHAHKALRIMDDILDLEEEKISAILEKVNSDPEPVSIKAPEIELWENILRKAKQGRRTGIGITAEGDMLAALGIRYGTDEAIDFSEKVHKTLALEVYRESVNLAKERGKFEIYDAEKEKDNPFINRIKNEDSQLYEDMVKYGRRNISMLTIAPTGTVSIMTKTTSGIEPAFRAAYQRNVKVEGKDKDTTVDFIDKDGVKWHTYNVVHHKFREWLVLNGYDISGIDDIKDEEEFNKRVIEPIKESPYFGATSEDVDWIKKVEMQGRIQEWVDHSISATTNMPKGTSKEIVAEAYMKAWESGCKGMTVYVDGSIGPGVLNTGKGNLEKLVEKVTFVDTELGSTAIKQGDDAEYYNIKKGKETYHLSIVGEFWEDPETKKVYSIPSKIFQNTKPLGRESSSEFSQSGLDRTNILKVDNPDWAERIREWKSVTGDRIEGFGPGRINSPSHGVGLAFEHYCLSRGIVAYDGNNLINVINKKSLKRITDKNKIDKLKKSMKNINGDSDKLKQKIYENIQEDFVCPECGGTEFHREDGCSGLVCNACGWNEGTCD